MLMDVDWNENIETFKNCYASTLDDFNCKFLGETKCEIVEEDSSSVIYLISTSNHYKKKLEIRLSQGININGEDYLFFNFIITNIAKEKPKEYTRLSFSLQDYCTYKNKKFNVPFDTDKKMRIENYFKFIKKVMVKYELETMLLSKSWVLIPIDWHPYK